MDRIEREHVNVSSAHLAGLRRAYQKDVQQIAERLTLRFQARKFDNTTLETEDPDRCPFLDLEEALCKLPICRRQASARLVIAASKYATAAPFEDGFELRPEPELHWPALAARCLARDVHDEAIRRGWARSTAERAWDHLQSMRRSGGRR